MSDARSEESRAAEKAIAGQAAQIPGATEAPEAPEVTLVAIRDAKAFTFGPPIAFMNEALAVRSFVDLVNDQEGPYWAHPEDYALFVLGKYSPTYGEVQSEPSPRCLAMAVNLMKKEA